MKLIFKLGSDSDSCFYRSLPHYEHVIFARATLRDSFKLFDSWTT